MWGIYSLVWLRGDNILDYVKQLNKTAKGLDATRPTVACSNQDGDINFVSDLIVWQQDLGWERGSFDDLKVWRESLSKDWANLRSSVAYGESGSIDQQTDDAMKPATIDERWLPERWHTEFHEQYAHVWHKTRSSGEYGLTICSSSAQYATMMVSLAREWYHLTVRTRKMLTTYIAHYGTRRVPRYTYRKSVVTFVKTLFRQSRFTLRPKMLLY